MIQFGDFANEQAKRRIAKLTGIILLAAQFACQHALQFLIIANAQRNIVR